MASLLCVGQNHVSMQKNTEALMILCLYCTEREANTANIQGKGKSNVMYN